MRINPVVCKSAGLLVLSFLASCGPNEQELAEREKNLIDSTRSAAEKQIQDKLAKQKQDQADANKMKADRTRRLNDKQCLEKSLTDLSAELETQKIILEDLKTPKFLRTPEEKEKQLKNQITKINELELQIEKCNNLINKINKGLMYERPAECMELDMDIPTEKSSSTEPVDSVAGVYVTI